MNSPVSSTPALAATFDSMAALMAAVKWLREQGYSSIELYSPYPPEHADDLLGLERPNISRYVLAAGLGGAALGFIAQWYPNAWDYPINAGGRPLLSLPAWVPITFELGVLFAAFAAVIALLVSCGLPKLWDPLFEIEGSWRITTDQYWLTLDSTDTHFEPARTVREVRSLGAIEVHLLELI